MGILIAAFASRPAGKREKGFLQPSPVERIFNRIFGALVRLGFGPGHSYLLEVRGRKTGRIYTAPVGLLEIEGRRYLVCPRGRAQWVRNAEAAGKVALVKGHRREEFTVRSLPDAEKPLILGNYLDRYKTTVQRYFPVPAGSDPEAFRPVADQYPVFELSRSA